MPRKEIPKLLGGIACNFGRENQAVSSVFVRELLLLLPNTQHNASITHHTPLPRTSQSFFDPQTSGW